VALAVADILETRAELDRLSVPYWLIEGPTSPDSCGNMLELHQIDKCNSRASNHAKV